MIKIYLGYFLPQRYNKKTKKNNILKKITQKNLYINIFLVKKSFWSVFIAYNEDRRLKIRLCELS